MNGAKVAAGVRSLATLGRNYLLAAAIAGSLGSAASIVAMRLGVVEFWPGGGLAQRTRSLEHGQDSIRTDMAALRRVSLDSDASLRAQILRLDTLVKEGAADRKDLRQSQDVLLWFNCLRGPTDQPQYIRAVCDRVLRR